jgi:hypothetical protein
MSDVHPQRDVRLTTGIARERMMTKVFVTIGPSLDGYMAPEGMTLEHSPALSPSYA